MKGKVSEKKRKKGGLKRGLGVFMFVFCVFHFLVCLFVAFSVFQACKLIEQLQKVLKHDYVKYTQC